MNGTKKNILTYGTFDLFHIGHLRLLKRLKDLGDYLIVGCSTDEFNEKKGKKTVIPYEQRREILLGCRYVDEVIPEYGWDQKIDDITSLNIDVFAMGDDWSGKFDFLESYCSVVYLARTENVSTTDVKYWIAQQFRSELLRAENLTTDIQSILHDLLN